MAITMGGRPNAAQQAHERSQNTRKEAEVAADKTHINNALLRLGGRVNEGDLSRAQGTNSSYYLQSGQDKLLVKFNNSSDQHPEISGIGKHGNKILLNTNMGIGLVIKDQVLKIIGAERTELLARINQLKSNPNAEINLAGIRLSREPQTDNGVLYRGTYKEGEKSYPFSIAKFNPGSSSESYLLEVDGHSRLVSTSIMKDVATTSKDSERFRVLKAFFEKNEAQCKAQGK